MKTIKLSLFILIASLFGACEQADTLDLVDPSEAIGEQEEPPSPLEMQWVTRMDYEKEIVNLAQGTIYKNWYLRSGDLNEPPTVMAFNKINGDKDWEIVIDELDGSEIKQMHQVDDLLICSNSYHVFAIELSSKEFLWNVRLKDQGTRIGRTTIASNGMLYVKADFSFGSPGQVLHLYEFDPYTGENQMVYSKPPDSTGIYSCSPPAIWHDPDLGKDILIFNLFPDSFAPPEEGSQYVVGVDPDDRYTELFTIPVVDKFSSNGGHPPIIYNNTVITGGWDNMYCFDLITHEKKWETSFGYPWSIWNKTNHLLYDDRLYVNNSQFDVTCLNPETGTKIWHNTEDAPNCTDNMVYYEQQNLLVFTSWGLGSVMFLDGLTGRLVHRERKYDNSVFNNDVVYDEELDMFFTSTYKHAMGFKIKRP